VLSYLSFFSSPFSLYFNFLFFFLKKNFFTCASSWPCKTFSWPCKTSLCVCFLYFCFCGRRYIEIYRCRVSSPFFPFTTQLILSFLVYSSWAILIFAIYLVIYGLKIERRKKTLQIVMLVYSWEYENWITIWV
jgi:hypothetical protein